MNKNIIYLENVPNLTPNATKEKYIKMKIALMSMPVSQKIDNSSMHTMPPMALYLLAAVLKQDSHIVKIVDPVHFMYYRPYKDNMNFNEFVTQSIEDIDVICISSNTLNWPSNKLLIKTIREINKKITIVLGGLHSSYFYDYIINSNDVDFIIREEGEKSLPRLIKALENNEDLMNVPGLVYRQNNKAATNEPIEVTKQEIQQTPMPSYELMPHKIYPVMPIMTSRGCKYGCRFCSIPRKHRWVGFDAEWVIDYVKNVIDKYMGCFLYNHIYFTDDCFTADPRRAIRILEEVLQLDINLTIEARAMDLQNVDLLKVLASNKISRIAIGVESGYNSGLKKVKKGLTIEDLNWTLELLKKYDLTKKAWFSFIYCFPWETVEDCLKTIDYAASIVKKYDVSVNMNHLYLYPSQIWEERAEYNINVNEDIFDEDSLFGDSVFYKTHPNFTYSDINYIMKYILKYEEKGIILRSK